MDQRDFVGTDGTRLQRLDAVKDVVGAFIAARQGERLALIVFGSRAFVQAPFTEDLRSLNALLEQTSVGMAGRIPPSAMRSAWPSAASKSARSSNGC